MYGLRGHGRLTFDAWGCSTRLQALRHVFSTRRFCHEGHSGVSCRIGSPRRGALSGAQGHSGVSCRIGSPRRGALSRSYCSFQVSQTA